MNDVESGQVGEDTEAHDTLGEQPAEPAQPEPVAEPEPSEPSEPEPSEPAAA